MDAECPLFWGAGGQKKATTGLVAAALYMLGNKKTLPTQESFTLYPKCEMVICRPLYGSKTDLWLRFWIAKFCITTELRDIGYPLKAFFTTLPPTLPFPKRAEKLPKACPIFSAFNYSVL